MLVARKRNWLSILLTTCFICCLSLYAQAAQAKEEEQANKSETPKEIETRSITGKVDVIRPGYITVIYYEGRKKDGSMTDKEMVIPLDENVKLLNIRKIDSLKEGDTIEVTFDEASWMDKEGVGRNERKTKVIRFISPATTGLRSGI